MVIDGGIGFRGWLRGKEVVVGLKIYVKREKEGVFWFYGEKADVGERTSRRLLTEMVVMRGTQFNIALY